MNQKYRSWIKSKNKMVYKQFWDRNWYSTEKNDENGCHTYCSTNNIQYDCEVMRGTGLKDSEGNEIYEGDIVLFKRNIKSELANEKAVIEFCDSGWCFDLSIFYPLRKEGWCCQICGRNLDCKIIGNVHKNQELLKKAWKVN